MSISENNATYKRSLASIRATITALSLLGISTLPRRFSFSTEYSSTPS